MVRNPPAAPPALPPMDVESLRAARTKRIAKRAHQNLGWLVESRNAIQHYMLDLHARKPSSGARRDSKHWQSLVGVAFSLWRAVFLLVDIEHKRKHGEVDEHADAFLKQVIRTNAISFADDVRASKWSSGYYVQNAQLRLVMLAEEIDLEYGREHLTGAPLRDRWSSALGAARAALDVVSPRERGGR